MQKSTVKFLMVLMAAAVAGGFFSTASLAANTTGGASAADPWAGTKWLIRARVIGVLPDENDQTLAGDPAPIGVGNAVMPELDITYFFTDNIAVELILAVAKHSVSLEGAGKISDIWILPPTLTLQYHFPMGTVKPYIGVGVNYTTVLSSKGTAIIEGMDNWGDGFGIALQAGVDIALDDKWSLNLDVKKIWLNLDARVTSAALPASADIDPWIIGAGVGRRF